MFECENTWEEEDSLPSLSDALFGNSKPAKIIKNALKEAQSNEQTEVKLTRKQWKTRQKNKRRAKKRNEQNTIITSSTEESISTNPVELKKNNLNLKPDLNFVVNNPENNTILTKEPNTNLSVNKSINIETKVEPSKPKISHQQALKRKRLQALLSTENQTNQNPTQTNTFKKPKQTEINKNEELRESNKNGKPVKPESIVKLKDNNNLTGKLTTKLHGSRFRFINEQMYSCPSKDTIKLLNDDPESFNIYHKGYLAQVSKWPIKPLDVIIKWIKARSSKLVVADFGCGEAFLAQSVKNKVHSFDLVALNDHVTVADISNVPLENGVVDVVVFCLSLMGTNMADFIYEANRVLKQRGVLKIAEVESRFNGHKRFVNDIKRFGFSLLKKDTSNNYFHTFDFLKTKNVGKDGSGQGCEFAQLQLKPCLYKKR